LARAAGSTMLVTDAARMSAPMDLADRSSSDLLRPFQLESSGLRGRFVRLGRTLDRVLEAHAYPEPVSRLLGQLLVLAGGLAGGLKFDGMFSLQVRGDGPVGFMVADCTNHGRMRGYASFDAQAIDAASTERELLGEGLLALTVDQTRIGGELQQGIVSLEGRTLTDAMLAYFRTSEQIRTAIKLAIGRDPRSGGWHGGAIILQALPAAPGAAEEAAREAWQEAMLLLETASEAELTGPDLDPDTVLYRLFHETGVRVWDALPLEAGCSCTEARVRAMLERFPAATLAEMRLPDGRIEVTCQFCNRLYSFDEAAIAALAARRRH